MTHVILTVGIPASGKSTYARQYARENPRVILTCRDDIRDAYGFPFGDSKIEQRITIIERQQIDVALADGFDVIVADTNINSHFRNDLIKFCHKRGADVEIKVFPISLDEAIKRDLARQKPVGADVITRLYNQMQAQNIQDELIPCQIFAPYAHSVDMPKKRAYIFDIDGTVASHEGNRSPYDYTKVAGDFPKDDVIRVARIAAHSGYKVVFVSGRDSSCYDDTKAWLTKHMGDFEFDLIMRQADDKRPDWVIKNELYDAEVIPKYDIMGVYEDRDQLVLHLRRRGMTVFQVNYGRF